MDPAFRQEGFLMSSLVCYYRLYIIYSLRQGSILAHARNSKIKINNVDNVFIELIEYIIYSLMLFVEEEEDNRMNVSSDVVDHCSNR